MFLLLEQLIDTLFGENTDINIRNTKDFTYVNIQNEYYSAGVCIKKNKHQENNTVISVPRRIKPFKKQ